MDILAVGDIICQTNTGTWNYQPAASVGIMISQLITTDNDTKIYGVGTITTNSIALCGVKGGGTGYKTTELRSMNGNLHGNLKFFINNGGYFSFTTAAGHYIGFTGIQVQ